MALILVVEDEKNIARAVKDKLAREGFTVESVYSGEEALSCLEEGIPALVILDVMMPGMGGYEVVRRIRADKRMQSVKIMLLTVLPEEEKESDIEVDAWLRKPYKGSDLIEKVRALTAPANPPATSD